jgi:ubiquinol-cytochrome c reductase cytochrome c subunit
MRAGVTRLSPALIAALATGAAVLWLAPSFAQPAGSPPTKSGATPADGSRVERGRELFEEGCSSCHGFDARGVAGQGPTLRGVGALAADFYLRTGRMPLSYPGEEPSRAEPRYSNRQIEAIVAYVGSFGGPAIPRVDPRGGSLSEGMHLFASSCAGCHAITAAGGVATGASAPPLAKSTPTQIGEAVRIGPYLMPRFNRRLIDSGQVNSLARYVDYTQSPDDAGGWGIGHIGPVPEGMVAWLLAAAALLLIARLIGERRKAGG